METFLAELKRRHIYRVTAAYAVVAWVLIQLVSNVSPMLRLPDWAGTLVLVLLLVGFPVALLFAWIHQLAPESSTLTRVTTGKLDWALIGALVVVIALVSYEQFVPPLSAGTVQQARKTGHVIGTMHKFDLALRSLPSKGISPWLTNFHRLHAVLFFHASVPALPYWVQVWP